VPDYDYIGNHQFHLTDDKSRNDAQTLAGYPLNVTPDAHWPGLTADPNKQRFDVDKMLEVADWIDSQIKSIQSANYTPESLAGTATVSYGPADWNAANYLRQSSGEVAKTVSNYARQLVTNLQEAATAIRTAAAKYRGAEGTNTDTMNTQQTNLTGQPAPTSWA
jgi:hypothetical protein